MLLLKKMKIAHQSNKYFLCNKKLNLTSMKWSLQPKNLERELPLKAISSEVLSLIAAQSKTLILCTEEQLVKKVAVTAKVPQ